jgi:hypothetical protein
VLVFKAPTSKHITDGQMLVMASSSSSSSSSGDNGGRVKHGGLVKSALTARKKRAQYLASHMQQHGLSLVSDPGTSAQLRSTQQLEQFMDGCPFDDMQHLFQHNESECVGYVNRTKCILRDDGTELLPVSCCCCCCCCCCFCQ